MSWTSTRRIRTAATGAAGIGICWTAADALRTVRGVPGLPLDALWASHVGALGSPFTVDVAEVLAAVGGSPGSVVVAVAVALLILWRRGVRAALAFVGAAVLSQLNVTLMKLVDLRPGPSGHLFEGLGSFPSGHTANAAVLAVTAGVLLHRRPVWAAGAGYVALMAVGRTLIGAHWLTDTIGGAFCGAGAALVVWSLAAPPAPAVLPAGATG